MGLPITTDYEPDVSQAAKAAFDHWWAVDEIFGDLLDPQTEALTTHAETGVNGEWGRYAFLTPEETASLALCGFEVGDAHGR